MVSLTGDLYVGFLLCKEGSWDLMFLAGESHRAALLFPEAVLLLFSSTWGVAIVVEFRHQRLVCYKNSSAGHVEALLQVQFGKGL